MARPMPPQMQQGAQTRKDTKSARARLDDETTKPPDSKSNKKKNKMAASKPDPVTVAARPSSKASIRIEKPKALSTKV